MIQITLMYNNKKLINKEFNPNDSGQTIIKYLIQNYPQFEHIYEDCFKIHSKKFNFQIIPDQPLSQQLGQTSADRFTIEIDQTLQDLSSTSSQTNQQQSNIIISQVDKQQIQIPQRNNNNQNLVQSQYNDNVQRLNEVEQQNHSQQFINQAPIIQQQIFDEELFKSQQFLNQQQKMIELKIIYLQKQLQIELPVELKLIELNNEIKKQFNISEPFQMIYNNENLLIYDQELRLDQLNIKNKSEIKILTNTQQSVIFF